MKIFKFCLILSFLFPSLNASADKNIRVVGGLNKNQPISFGEVIYDETTTIWSQAYVRYHVRYAYMGLSNRSLKIKYSYEIDDTLSRKKSEVITETLLLPLDKSRTAYLELHEIPRRPEIPIVERKNLIISVDNNKRLNVFVRAVSKYKGVRQ